MSNAYVALQKRHQKEVDEFPIYFAFGNEQFDELVNRLNLSKDKDSENYFGKRLVKAFAGGLVLKEDATRLVDMLKRHKAEMNEQIAADKTGKGFIYQMFRYELNNHEYGYTGETEDTLEALGFSEEEIDADPRLSLGLELARRSIEEAEW